MLNLLRGQRPPIPTDRDVGNYQVLFDFEVQHEYYNADGGRCNDLEPYLTARSRGLMASLGLLLRDTGTGFKVLYNASRPDRLLHEFDVLCFGLISRNPHFAAMTVLPAELRAVDKSYHICNAEGAHFGPTIDPKQVFPIDKGHELITTAVGSRTTLRDLCCRDTYVFENPKKLNLRQYHEGKYDLEITDEAGQSTTKPPFLYCRFRPSPLALVQLLMARPFDRQGGVYPLTRSKQGPSGDWGYKVTPCTYVLNFAARPTLWVYYVVTRSPLPGSSKLVIEHAAGDLHEGPPVPPFRGPTQVSLPNRETAYRFESAGPIPLQQRSTIDLKLILRVHRRGSAIEERVLVERLPVASAERVRPQHPFGESGQPESEPPLSEIYVYV